MILILKIVVIDAVILSKHFHPMIPIVDVRRVVSDDGRIRESAVSGRAIVATKFDDRTRAVRQRTALEFQAVDDQPVARNIKCRVAIDDNFSWRLGTQRDRIAGSAKPVELDLLVGPHAVCHRQDVAWPGRLQRSRDVACGGYEKLCGPSLCARSPGN